MTVVTAGCWPSGPSGSPPLETPADPPVTSGPATVAPTTEPSPPDRPDAEEALRVARLFGEWSTGSSASILGDLTAPEFADDTATVEWLDVVRSSSPDRPHSFVSAGPVLEPWGDRVCLTMVTADGQGGTVAVTLGEFEDPTTGERRWGVEAVVLEPRCATALAENFVHAATDPVQAAEATAFVDPQLTDAPRFVDVLESLGSLPTGTAVVAEPMDVAAGAPPTVCVGIGGDAAVKITAGDDPIGWQVADAVLTLSGCRAGNGPTDVTVPLPPDRDGALDLGPDGVLVGTWRYTLQVRDATTGELIRDLGVGSEGLPVPSVSDDGRWLFTTVLQTGCLSNVVAVDPVDGSTTVVATGGWVAVSPDGRRVAWIGPDCGRNDLTVLDLTDGTVRTYPTALPPEDRWIALSDLAFSPDGDRLAYLRREGPIVNGSLEPQDPTVPAILQVLDLATAETTDDAQPVQILPRTGEDLHSPVWRDPDTLWVAAEPVPRDDAFGTTARILEVAVVPSGPPRTVLERGASITQIALDATRTQLLWIETNPKVPGKHAQRDALWILDDGAPTRLAADIAAADW